MRQSAVVVLVAAAGLAFAGCPKSKPAPPPPAPVAPPVPPPAPPPEREVAVQEDEYTRIKNMPIDEIERMGLLAEIRFDFDRADIRDGDRTILARNAEVLKKFDFLQITIEGHCDERGTVDYNLALGERRARAAFDYLSSLGVPVERLKTTSYGKEIPLCQEHNEGCWARNRRAHFTVSGKSPRR